MIIFFLQFMNPQQAHSPFWYFFPRRWKIWWWCESKFRYLFSYYKLLKTSSTDKQFSSDEEGEWEKNYFFDVKQSFAHFMRWFFNRVFYYELKAEGNTFFLWFSVEISWKSNWKSFCFSWFCLMHGAFWPKVYFMWKFDVLWSFI